MRTSSKRRLSALSLAALLALVFSFASPALAGAKGQDKGDKGGDDKTERPWVSGSDDDDSAADTDPADADADNAHPSGNDRHEDKGTQGHSTSDPDDDGRGPDRSNGGADKPFESSDGTGGVDQQDQDGNNGCGNDDDFEDDNEGWCGKPNRSTDTPPPPPPPPVVDDDGDVKCPESGEMGNGQGKGPKDCDDGDKPECPEADELAAGEEMPEECTTTTPTGTVEGDTLAPGAVLGTELQNNPSSAVTGDDTKVLGVQLERTAPGAVAAAGAAAPAGTSVLGAALARTGLSFTVLALAIALGLLAVGFALQRMGRRASEV